MKAAVFYGGQDIRVEELPTPQPEPGEVLIRVRSGGICGSDLHPYRGQNPYGLREPHQRGHELAGKVAGLGEGVTSLEIGRRVGIQAEHLLGCGTCRYCLRGEYHLCPSRGMPHGRRTESHGFSQYDTCVASNCYPLPDDVSYDAASQVDCYACGVHALNRAKPTPDWTAVIIGTGAIGMTLGQVARVYGVGRIIMVGTRHEPLAIAKKCGATDDVVSNADGDPVEAVLHATNGEGADIVFETVGGTAPTLSQAVGMARRGGIVSVLGVFTGAQEVDAVTAYRKELRIQWSNSYSSWQGVSEYKTALDLLAAGRVDPSGFITHHYPVEQIGEAFAAANDKRRSGAIKVIVNP
ncbi:MAG: alcohol dehydrogenase catalytic domain-containing protein [Chloroflexi bacterium]|nr:alcohol dehydrogenase catalytic domain-containing protein [Chloroflexota bacterium]MCI0822921.1 alcohol dehydrogenase catalytic domain-containing protein [Chloroflexota bacterium]